ncbi:MAG: hypothetical protein C4318_05820 [Acidimicrobiia bacterium]
MAVSTPHGDTASSGDNSSANNTNAERIPSVAQFVSQASHDLKTPLAAISGYAVTLERRGDSLEQSLRYEMLYHIRGAAARMQSAVDQLVDYARLELGAIEWEPVLVDVSEVVREIVRRVREGFKDSDIEIEVEKTGLSVAKADPGRLSKALEALVENALRHGSGKARVSLRVTAQFVSVRVEDGGEGIPDGLKSLIFSADLEGRPRSGQPRGLGIALHNARRIMRLQGGDIRLVTPRSTGDYPGAVFELLVPRATQLVREDIEDA